MTDVATKTVDQQLVKKTHPIRGILWGLMMGLGLSIVLVLTKVIPLELVPMLIVLLVGTVLGTLWSVFGPAKHAKGVPAAATESTDTDVEATTPRPAVDEQQPADTTDAASPDQPAEHD
jgi:predicted lipid-binding transport protein (Tim44 family)